jgi:cytoskeletal protein RodZ
MTEQQQPNPVDELFRKTYESLPDSPSASGWDKPSDRVWQHVQTNMPQAKQGWSIQSIALLTTMAVLVVAGLYWFMSDAVQPQNVQPASTEQPVVTPATQENQPVEAADSTPKGSSGTKATPASEQPSKQIHTPAGKTSDNAAQPLPGSKPTLPPNSTVVNKNKQQ